MLQRSPRRRLFNEYARQLQRRYPSMRDEVQARLQRVNAVWEQLQRAVCPVPAGARDEAAMIKGEAPACSLPRPRRRVSRSGHD